MTNARPSLVFGIIMALLCLAALVFSQVGITWSSIGQVVVIAIVVLGFLAFIFKGEK